MKITDRLPLPRKINSDYHLAIAVEWLDFGQPLKLHSPLVYSAFEFRNCIERIAFELLILFREGELTQADLKTAEKLDKMIEYVVKVNGPKYLLEKKMLFIKCLMEEMGYPVKIAVFKVGDLMKYWQACSEYCHKYLTIHDSWEDQQYIEKGYTKLNEIRSYLFEILDGKYRANMHISDADVLNLQKEFLDGKIDEASLRTRAKLMMPVLSQRMRLKKME